MRDFGRGIRRVFAAAVGAALVFLGFVFADDVVAGRVPFVVNVDARVAITPPVGLAGASGVTANLAAGADTVLAIVLAGGTSPVRRGAHTTRAAAPVAVYYSRGNLSLTLSPRALGSADAALYTVTGKRVLHGRAPPPPNSRNISRNNVAAGVYLLSVKGVDGQTYNTRLSHTGGRLNVNIGFYDGGLTESPSPQAAAAAAAASDYGEWGVAVSAAGYEDSTYTFAPVAGDNAGHIITLRKSSDGGDLPPHFNPDIKYGSFTDTRDGANNRKYYTVTIGEQTWMAENLDYAGADGSLGVCYNDEPDSCAKYGRLYNWATAMGIASSFNSSRWNGSDVKHQGICPSGWHVPSNAEWTQLTDAFGGSSTAGRKLKSQTGWYACGPSGSSYVCEDAHGFSALPGGYGYGSSFYRAGDLGRWWSATEGDARFAWYRDTYYNNEGVGRNDNGKAYLFSVRCVRDD